MNFSIATPASLEEALHEYAVSGGSYLAGGTVLFVNAHRGIEIDKRLISLEHVSELNCLSLHGDTLTIGANITMDSIECSELCRRFAGCLWLAAKEVAGPQVRHRATLGGNIASASPSADCAAPLLALNASIVLAGQSDCRRVPIRNFFLGFRKIDILPGEIIVGFEIPVSGDAFSAFQKVGKRNALAVSVINMALHSNGNEVSVAVGSASPYPVFCSQTSRILSAGGSIKEAQAAIQQEISPIDDRWATASYRRKVCSNLLGVMCDEAKEAMR